MSQKGHDDSKCGVNHHPCHTLSYTLNERAKDNDIIQINSEYSFSFPVRKQHLRLRNITLIGIQGRARIHGQVPVVDSYLFDDATRGLYTSPVQVSINLLNLRLMRIGIIKLKNTSTTLNVKVVNCTVSKLSKSPIVDSSAAKTTVILKRSIVRQVSKGLQVKSKEFSFSIESSTIDNSGRYYPEQDCPQFIVTGKFESLVAHFSKSSFKYTFLIDLAASHKNRSNVSITDSIFDDDIKNFKHNGCFSGITLRNTTVLIVNSNFTNIILRKSLIKAIDSFVTFKECIFSNISSKLGMFSLSSSIISSFNKTDAIDSKLNGLNYGSVYLKSTEGIFQNCIFHNNTVNGQYGNGGAIYVDSSNITLQQCLLKRNTVTYSGGAIFMVKTRGIFVNCTFEKNSAESSLQRADYGGAVSAVDNSHLTMHQCGFKDNTATGTGGATYIQNSHSLFESCIFEKNNANSLNQDTRGGAITAFGFDTNISIKQCLFQDNSAVFSGGAIAITRSRILLLKNSTFVRNQVKTLTGHGYGGAIHLFGNKNLIVQQCLFKENTATYSGGAIMMVKTRGIFVNCTFEKNTAESSLQRPDFGGAVCALDNSHLTIHQCIFKENTATYIGGATYIQNSHSLFESCIFEKNKVNSLNQDTRGGAITAFGSGTNISIKQCLFKDNSAAFSGGAIDIQHSRILFLKNSTFVRNTVKTLTGKGHGGAIGLHRNKDLIVQQCLFKENTATYSGGAIELSKTRGIFVNCNFEKNSAESSLQRPGYGGAVSALDNPHLTMHQCGLKYNTATYNDGAILMGKTRGIFVNCTFEKNSAERSLQRAGFGGAVSAIYNSHLTMHQCGFKYNTAAYNGGAIQMVKTRGIFVNCTFEKNSAESSLKRTGFGGAVSAADNSHLTMRQCGFKYNTAPFSGGAIMMRKTRGIFVNCTFEKNSAESSLQRVDFGGAVCAVDNSHLTMHQCGFKDNTATGTGGATYIQNSHGLFESCVFEKNKVNSLNQDTRGGAITAFGSGTNISIKQCLFKDNSAVFSSGAIAITRSRILLLKDSTFVRNQVKTLTGHGYGGAIHLFGNKNLIVQQCLFKENTATYSGGAIMMVKTRGIFVNCTFEKNSAESSLQRGGFGGAVCAQYNSHLTMHQCGFKDNTAAGTGGATYILNSNSLFESCIFDKNKANSLNQNSSAGAIGAFGSGIKITIKQYLFKENAAICRGGAIYIHRSRSLLLKNSTFVRNKVITLTGYGGGAILLHRNKNLMVQQCLFKENTATYSGGAIKMVKTRGIFVNCTFEKNSAECSLQRSGFGGAVCALYNSHLTMHQCGFKYNTATYNGGATHVQKSHGLFESCIFKKNKVIYFGGAITATRKSNLTMHQCIFKDNTAVAWGGATYIQESQSSFENCTFEGKV